MKEFIDVAEAAAILKCTCDRIVDHIDAGLIPAIMLEADWVIPYGGFVSHMSKIAELNARAIRNKAEQVASTIMGNAQSAGETEVSGSGYARSAAGRALSGAAGVLAPSDYADLMKRELEKDFGKIAAGKVWRFEEEQNQKAHAEAMAQSKNMMIRSLFDKASYAAPENIVKIVGL